MTALSPEETLAAIVEHQARLRAFLEQFDDSTLSARPAAGDWSAIEVVHHLVLTAQHHLGPFVSGGLGWSERGAQRTRTGAIPSTEVRAIFDEWGHVYEAACRGVDLDQPDRPVAVPARGMRTLSFQLSRFLRHQQAHGRQAARALSIVTGSEVRVPRAPRSRTS